MQRQRSRRSDTVDCKHPLRWWVCALEIPPNTTFPAIWVGNLFLVRRSTVDVPPETVVLTTVQTVSFCLDPLCPAVAAACRGATMCLQVEQLSIRVVPLQLAKSQEIFVGHHVRPAQLAKDWRQTCHVACNVVLVWLALMALAIGAGQDVPQTCSTQFVMSAQGLTNIAPMDLLARHVLLAHSRCAVAWAANSAPASVLPIYRQMEHDARRVPQATNHGITFHLVPDAQPSHSRIMRPAFRDSTAMEACAFRVRVGRGQILIYLRVRCAF
eukprot:COSAG01_NODE_43_length_32320_cov_622.744763_30_plen_270_part_00